MIDGCAGGTLDASGLVKAYYEADFGANESARESALGAMLLAYSSL